MGDNRIGNNRSQVIDAGQNSRMDLLLRSESPHVQRILLHQRLKEEIEKNSVGKARYVDSELHSRNVIRSQAPTVSVVKQSAPNTNSSITKQQTKNGSWPSENDTEVGQTGKDTNCQVCLIKEVRQDLLNINKIVQERNEQISKLKARCLRSYFERQVS